MQHVLQSIPAEHELQAKNYNIMLFSNHFFYFIQNDNLYLILKEKT